MADNNLHFADSADYFPFEFKKRFSVPQNIGADSRHYRTRSGNHQEFAYDVEPALGGT